MSLNSARQIKHNLTTYSSEYNLLHFVLQQGMDVDDLTCAICLSVCRSAVEATCCGQLYCEVCIKQLQHCPTCRHGPFTTTTNKTVRRAIGKLRTTCENCNVEMQRCDMEAHAKECPMTKYECAASNCKFEGTQLQFSEHLMTKHKFDVLQLCSTRLKDVSNVQKSETKSSLTRTISNVSNFQKSEIKSSLKRTSSSGEDNAFVPQTDTVGTQTFTRSVLLNSAGRQAQVSRHNMKFYCGASIKNCGCGYDVADDQLIRFGCFCNQCGPEAGCNCAPCMELDILIRRLEGRSLVNRLGNPSKPNSKDNYRCHVNKKGRVCGTGMFQCRDCRSLDKQTNSPGGLYFSLTR